MGATIAQRCETAGGQHDGTTATVAPTFATGGMLVWVGLSILGAVAIVGGGVGLQIYIGAEPAYLTDDPVMVGSLPYYAGYFAYLSTMLWIGCSAVALLAGLLHRQIAGPGGLSLYYLSVAACCIYLGCDDAYMLHEIVLPKALNINEMVVLSLYAACAVLFFVVFARTIRQTPWPMLAIAGGLFGMSLLIDVTHWIGPFEGLVYPGFIEDGFKIAGILTGLAYVLRSSLISVGNLLADSNRAGV